MLLKISKIFCFYVKRANSENIFFRQAHATSAASREHLPARVEDFLQLDDADEQLIDRREDTCCDELLLNDVHKVVVVGDLDLAREVEREAMLVDEDALERARVLQVRVLHGRHEWVEHGIQRLGDLYAAQTDDETSVEELAARADDVDHLVHRHTVTETTKNPIVARQVDWKLLTTELLYRLF